MDSDSELEIADVLMDVDSFSESTTTPSPSPESEFHGNIPPSPSTIKSQKDMLAAQDRLSHMSPSKTQLSKAKFDFHLIDVKHIQELPSAKWSNNSCWLDLSMEAIWTALAFHGAFSEFEELMVTEEQAACPSPLYYLYLAFKFRLDHGILEFKGSQQGHAKPLTEIRDNLCEMLYKIRAVPGKVGDEQDTIVSYICYVFSFNIH